MRHEALHHVQLRTAGPRVPGLDLSVITLCVVTRPGQEPHGLAPGGLVVAGCLHHPVVPGHGPPLLSGHGPLVTGDVSSEQSACATLGRRLDLDCGLT